MIFPFHTLIIGQCVGIPKEHVKEAMVAVRAYQRRWKQLGWAYAAKTQSDGSITLQRLDDGDPVINGHEGIDIMPIDYEAKFFVKIEAETVRIFEKIMESDVGISGMKKELKCAGYMPVSVMRNYCTKIAIFKQHPLGSVKIFETTIDNLVKKHVFKKMSVNGIDCIIKVAHG